MRSRTGCLTCRARKLKCDERRPRCQNCQKAVRECRPSDGVVFRHQQNASMNGTDGSRTTEGSLPSFYSYKNTFGPDNVWLEIPKKVKFVYVTDPTVEYAIDPVLEVHDIDSLAQPQAEWVFMPGSESRSGDLATRGLEALSAAASRDQDSFPHSQPSHHDMASTAISYMAQNLNQSPSSSQFARPQPQIPCSPTFSVTSANNINFLLNPEKSRSLPLDPNQQSSPEHEDTVISPTATPSESEDNQPAKADPEVACLLHHSAEAPGS